MKTLKVGVAGLGTVGLSVLRILTSERENLQSRTGVFLEVSAVCARDPAKNRGMDLSHLTWVKTPQELVSCPDVDVIVEAMGGDGDPALSLVREALKAKKPVITANKALLAKHGVELARLAEAEHTPLLYEAAVAGGIPIIKELREGLAANNIQGIYGILNGTCNYILTAMESKGQGFAEVLKEAQELGYAEADPTLDVDGGDSGHKLALLAALAYGCNPDYEGLSVSGIRSVSAEDIKVADELGYRIKLVGQARRLADGRILRMVAPSLVPKTSPLAHVNGVLNGILIENDFAGVSFVSGRGAGGNPTASAVVADLVDLARGSNIYVFGCPADQLSGKAMARSDDWEGEYYIRLMVRDQPGVIAQIAPILRDCRISIESLIQRGRSSNQPVGIVITTHQTYGKDVEAAIAAIEKLDTVLEPPLIMPILNI
ncbi:MAG: homoserine dehydrogenase [Pseudobdellovibrionaceae bacterium]